MISRASSFSRPLALLLSLVRTSSRGQDASRPLAIEDYYRVLTITNPQIAPDGKTRPLLGHHADRGGQQHEDGDLHRAGGRVGAAGEGRGGAADAQPAARWTRRPGGDARASPDGKWIARTQEKPQPKDEPKYASEFEKRHQERFKGVTFDWKDFQRDGARLPGAESRRAARAADRPAAGAGEGTPKTLVDMDMRPGNLDVASRAAQTARVHGRRRLPRRAEVRPSRISGPSTTDGKVTRLTNDGAVHGDVDFSPDGKYLSYVAHVRHRHDHQAEAESWRSARSLHQAGGRQRRADQPHGELGSRADQRAMVARQQFIYFTAETGGETHLFRVPASPGAKVEQVTKGPRRLGNLTIDKAFTTIAYTVGLHEAPGDLYAANIDGTERAAADRRQSRPRRRAGAQQGGAAPVEEPRRHVDRRLAAHARRTTTPRKGPYPLDRRQPRRTARGDRLQLRLQEAVLRGQRLLRPRHELPKLHRLRRRVQVGDVGRVGQEGRRGRHRRHRRRHQEVPDRSEARRPHRPLVRRVHDELADHRSTRIASPRRLPAPGISNWISDYGTADIYRTKETEFFGTPWDKDARDRMIRQSPLTYAGNVKTPTLFVHGEVDQRVPYEEAEQMYFALKRRGVPAKMIRYAGQPHGIAGHWNNVAPHAERTPLVEHVLSSLWQGNVQPSASAAHPKPRLLRGSGAGNCELAATGHWLTGLLATGYWLLTHTAR